MKPFGFISDNGTFTTLNAPGAFSVSPKAINNRGGVFGSCRDSSGTHSFLYDDGTFTTLMSGCNIEAYGREHLSGRRLCDIRPGSRPAGNSSSRTSWLTQLTVANKLQEFCA
jgi:hypothetical protein